MKIVRNGDKITTVGKLKVGDLFILSEGEEGVFILTNQQQNGRWLVVDLEFGVGSFCSMTMPVVKVDGTLYIKEMEKDDIDD